MSVTDVDINLKAKNSSGKQTLWLNKHGDEYFFTLNGTYRGERMQIDFDEIDRNKLEEMKLQIELILDSEPYRTQRSAEQGIDVPNPGEK